MSDNKTRIPIEIGEQETTADCKVCGGIIMERYSIPYVPPPRDEDIIMEHCKDVLGYYCSICGIAYYKLPYT